MAFSDKTASDLDVAAALERHLDVAIQQPRFGPEFVQGEMLS